MDILVSHAPRMKYSRGNAKYDELLEVTSDDVKSIDDFLRRSLATYHVRHSSPSQHTLWSLHHSLLCLSAREMNRRGFRSAGSLTTVHVALTFQARSGSCRMYKNGLWTIESSSAVFNDFFFGFLDKMMPLHTATYVLEMTGQISFIRFSLQRQLTCSVVCNSTTRMRR